MDSDIKSTAEYHDFVLLGLDDVAHILGLSLRTLEDKSYRRKLGLALYEFKIGGKVRFQLADILTFVKQQKEKES